MQNNAPEKEKIGIYIHWPFCQSKCPYCDFKTVVPTSPVDQQQWLQAYQLQLNHFLSQINPNSYYLESIFFGGGTPSLMQTEIIAQLISSCLSAIKPAPNTTPEITIESNPSSIEANKFMLLKQAGVNRVSIGVQSLNNENLKWLGRTHTAQDAKNAIAAAKEHFTNYSFDIIYSLKDQKPNQWEKELEEILSLATHHISLYNLTIEEGTKFGQLHKKNKLQLPTSKTSEDLYFITNKALEENGFQRYETSNYAKQNHQSLHNLLYWNYNDYIGIGPNAAGRFWNAKGQKIATKSKTNPSQWLTAATNQNNQQAAYKAETLTTEDQTKELFLMGMRITNGINLQNAANRLRIPESQILTPELENKINTLQNHGLVAFQNNILSPTKKGMHYSNALSSFLV